MVENKVETLDTFGTAGLSCTLSLKWAEVLHIYVKLCTLWEEKAQNFKAKSNAKYSPGTKVRVEAP